MSKFYKTELPEPYTLEEEKEVMQRVRNGDRTARDDMIRHNLRLVIRVVKRYCDYGIELEDLVGVGNAGLIKAVDSFDPDFGFTFATYAWRCIENEICLEVVRQCKHQSVLSLNAPVYGEEEDVFLMDVLPAHSTVSDVVNRIVDRDTVRMALKALTKQEAQVILMRFGFLGRARSRSETAKLLHLKTTIVLKIEQKAMRKMRGTCIANALLSM